MGDTHTDIIIVGAGLSGIGAACHLEQKNPNKSYRILEMRTELGGTWSLFKYPGIRSDSDMYTFGYSFKTWNLSTSYADAGSILKYLNEAADEYDVKKHITYSQKVMHAAFDSSTALWTVTTQNTETGVSKSYTARFLFSCSGYYSYEGGYTPDFKGTKKFNGQIIHPQKWPNDLDYTDKKVVVIGSGATAVTLIPAMADKTKHITMLQRSPSYVGALPNTDSVAKTIKKIFPQKTAHKLIRIKNVTVDMIFFNLCRRYPETMKKFIIGKAEKILGDVPVDPHFTPNYNPWEQRFCLAPDGDLFKTLRSNKADIVTDKIDRFTEEGILLESGKELQADIIVTATGLNLLPFGGAKVDIDNNPVDVSEKVTYRSLMLNDIPNFIFFAGYTNAPWTLKSDLTSEYISRVLRHMDKHRYKTFVAKLDVPNMKRIPLLNLNSGYIHRAEKLFPKQGDRFPWKLKQNYFVDYVSLRWKSIRDNVLKFS